MPATQKARISLSRSLSTRVGRMSERVQKIALTPLSFPALFLPTLTPSVFASTASVFHRTILVMFLSFFLVVRNPEKMLFERGCLHDAQHNVMMSLLVPSMILHTMRWPFVHPSICVHCSCASLCANWPTTNSLRSHSRLTRRMDGRR